MTQTVTLTQPVRVSGSVLAAGTTQTLAKDVAADLVRRGFATPVGVPAWIDNENSTNKKTAQINFNNRTLSYCDIVRNILSLNGDVVLCFLGDSTGDYTDELVYLFVQKLKLICNSSNNPRIVYKTFDAVTETYNTNSVIQAGEVEPQVTVSRTDAFGWAIDPTTAGSEGVELDIRVDCALDDWGYDTTDQSLVCRSGSAGNISWRFYIAAGGTAKLEWSENGTALKSQIHSTLYSWASFADASRRWVRATLKCDNGAGGHDVKFYTSSDGIAWTQSGTTRTGSGTTSIFDATTQTIEIGSRGASSGSHRSGNENVSAVGSFFNAYCSSTIDGPNRLPAAIRHLNGRDLQIGERKGSGQILVYNAHVAGAGLAWLGNADRSKKLIPVAPSSSYVWINSGHNDGPMMAISLFMDNLDNLITKIGERMKHPLITLCSQNPRYSPATAHTIATQKYIASILGHLARSKQMVFADLFNAYGQDRGLVKSDGVHPEVSGSALASIELQKAFGLVD